MIQARFFHPFNADAVHAGPADSIIIDGIDMFAGSELIATHRDNQWYHRGSPYTIVFVEDPVRLRFQNGIDNEHSVHGPFTGVKIVDGSIRHGDEFGDVLARLDQTSALWSLYSRQGEWRRITLTPINAEQSRGI